MRDINIITAAVAATTPDYRGLAACLLDKFEEVRKDPEYMAEYEKWKGGGMDVSRTSDGSMAV
jgi:hypothetical protein